MTGLRVLEWSFAAMAVWLAWSTAMELWVAWYSGVDDRLPTAHWWLGAARVTVFLLAAALVVATELAASDR